MLPESRVAADDPVVMLPPPTGWRKVLVPLAQAVQKDDQRRLGQRRTAALARRFNRSAERFVEMRRRAYEERFDELLEGAGGRTVEPIVMRDGFALDTSRTLPYLDALLAAGEQIIEERAGGQWELEKPYLQDISPERAMDDHPALLDFICSPDMVAAVAPTFGYIPALPGTLPEGVRLMESSTQFDPQADGPWRGSQLYHLDYHSTPTVYVIVAQRDIGPDDGPLHYIGREASRRVADALGLGARGAPYRVPDEAVNELVSDDEIHVFSAEEGTVLFLESSACLHFGSRRPATPRYQVQYGFTSPVRNDLLELWRPQRVFPVRPDDPPLRRLVLDRTLADIPRR
jgi:hypothetical protein